VLSQTYYPTKVVIEPNGLYRFHELTNLALSRLFVVTGQSSMEKTGVLAKLRTATRDANIEILISQRALTNPTHVDVDMIINEANAFNPDVIMGLGGGSSIDIAKIVGMILTNGGSCWDYINMTGKSGKKITKSAIPIIAVPTTSGSGSEATPFAVITHAKSKMKKGIGSSHLYPVLSILDPVLLTTMPAHQTAVTGFDAFAQAIEGFTSVNSTIHSEIYGIQALQLIIENFEKCYDAPKNLEARAKMAWGASMAGLSIGLVDVNLAHAMSHPLSGHFNIQHGLAVALCTVPAIRFNQEHVGNKYRQVAKLFGKDANSNHEAANIVIKKYRQLAEKFGISLKLKNYNIPEEKLVSVVTDTLEIGAIRTNPRPVMHSDLEHLFTAVWEGHDA
jgi:alcohol dehydrogenase